MAAPQFDWWGATSKLRYEVGETRSSPGVDRNRGTTLVGMG